MLNEVARLPFFLKESKARKARKLSIRKMKESNQQEIPIFYLKGNLNYLK